MRETLLEFLRRWGRRARHLARPADHERRMQEEMQFHIGMEAAELRRSGAADAEAQRAAMLAFGGVERIKEDGRDASGVRWIDDLRRDLAYALRQIRASPGFAAATVLTLGLGIGATTVMYSYGRAITSQESTLTSLDRLIYVGQGARDCEWCARISPANFHTIRDGARTLERVSMFVEWDPVYRGTEKAELLDGARVTPEFFTTLDAPAMLGRTLLPSDSVADQTSALVIAERMWRTRFNGDSAAIGQTMVLDRKPYTIVGVVRDANGYPRDADFWALLHLTPREASERREPRYRVVSRLRADAAFSSAAAEVAAISDRIAAEFSDEMGGGRTVLAAKPLSQLHQFGSDAEKWIFIAPVGLVLLIACFNVAGLLIARLSARERELAVRRAMGASAARLARQLLVETTMLTVVAGAVGALIARLGFQALFGWEDVPIDGRAYAVATVTGVVCGLFVALWPALRFARPRPQETLHESTRGATAGVDAARGRRWLVIAEVALTVVLLSAAGLLGRTVQQLYAIDPGFSSDRVLAMRLYDPPMGDSSAGRPDADRIDRIVNTISALPGIVSAGATLGLPYAHGSVTKPFELDGHHGDGSERLRARMQAATPNYFDALGVRMLRGRRFSEADGANASRVAIINRAVAERYFDGEDPVGRAVIIDSVRWEIVGVVATMFHGDVDELEPLEIYRPMKQWSRPSVWIAVRAIGDPTQLARPVAGVVREFDPDIAITRLLTMDALHTVENLGSERRILRLMTSFALAALLISTIGLYGLISYSVAQRTREFGVRRAVGATNAGVLRLVVGHGVKLATIGVALGLIGALAVMRVLQAMLFRVSPTDPGTLGVVAGLVVVVAIIAAWLPARRAMRVDPMSALRVD